MEKSSSEKLQNKVDIHNLIILDMSGSMNHYKEEAIHGYNQTILDIQKSQKKYKKTQNHYLTSIFFNSEEIKYVADNFKIEDVKLITNEFCPNSNTPLYDAIGEGITNLKKSLVSSKNSVVLVTIITDGQENSSKEYNLEALHNLISEANKNEWTVTFLGANLNVYEFSQSLSIHNHYTFTGDNKGVKDMFINDADSRSMFYKKINNYAESDMLLENLGILSKGYFKK